MQLSNEMTEVLSAEDALGTLRGSAYRRWQRLCKSDNELGNQVVGWDQLLAPMAHWLPETPVPEQVWTGIERALFAAPTPIRNTSRMRWVGVALAMAASLSLWLALPTTSPTIITPTPQLQALSTLSSEHEATRWQLSKQGDDQLSIRSSEVWQQPANRSLQLWAIDANGTPHSLGVIHLVKQTATLKLSAEQLAQLANVTVFAISDEPLGGSASALPSGPVLFTGKALSEREAT